MTADGQPPAPTARDDTVAGDPIPGAAAPLPVGVDGAAPWVARFRAPRVGLPRWARDAPRRCVVRSNVGGTWELYTWLAPDGALRQATRRPEGTSLGVLDPAGTELWWFDDTDGDEFGRWMRQPFDAPGPGAAEPGVAGVPAAYPAGLAIGRHRVVVGGSDDAGTTIWVAGRGGAAEVLYRNAEDASVADMSVDETLICLEHSEHGDSRHPALRVVRPDGGVVADLWDGPGRSLSAVGFAPVAGDPRILVVHERRGRPELLVWNPVQGSEQEIRLDVPGELEADWYPDADALLVRADARGRSWLLRHDLDSGRLTPLGTPAGLVAGFGARPGGSAWFSWSSAASPGGILDDRGDSVLVAPGEPAPESVPVEDVDVDGVHGFLSRPRTGAAPHPTVFVAHGGPTHHDTDSFAPDVAAWVDQGYAVVQVNYRGSTGYGSAWRDALETDVGHTELADIRAVRDDLVRRGITDPGRVVLTGASWGGYLTLLGLGTQPDAWSLGVAEVPVADYVAAYEDEMEGLKAFDRSLFGGSPVDVPEKYRRASPLTYAAEVAVPVLVVAGANDPRCPLRQIENYLSALGDLGKPHEVYRFDAGHGSLRIEERIRQQAVAMDFVRRHLRTG